MPFTQEQFFDLFSAYNLSVFPAQVLFNIVGVFAVFFLFKRNSFSNRFINSVLTFFWLWMGIVYHIIYFSKINPAAYLFGVFFIIQAIIFIIFGVIFNKITYSVPASGLAFTGIFLILFALFIYPFLGLLLNHVYPYSPTFGLPCPTTIFTFGLLLFSEKKLPVYLFIIPLLWSFIGFTAALNLGVYEDTALLLSGLIGGTLIIFIVNKKNNPVAGDYSFN